MGPEVRVGQLRLIPSELAHGPRHLARGLKPQLWSEVLSRSVWCGLFGGMVCPVLAQRAPCAPRWRLSCRTPLAGPHVHCRVLVGCCRERVGCWRVLVGCCGVRVGRCRVRVGCWRVLVGWCVLSAVRCVSGAGGYLSVAVGCVLGAVGCVSVAGGYLSAGAC